MHRFNQMLLLIFLLASLHSFPAYQLPNSRDFRRHKLKLASVQTYSDDKAALAKSFVSSGFGLANPALLDENFSFQFRNKRISKSQYLAGFSREVSSVQRASPDFDYRSYSFTVDEKDSSKIWFKIRPTGDVYLPNQKSFELPIQQFSLTVKDKKISSLSNGIVVDRLSGNTGGLAGPLGLLYALGESPNEFTYLPPLVVIKRFFGRKRKNIVNNNQLSPFPSSVMFALASKVVDSCLSGTQPSLLTNDFVYSNPLVGPLSKEEFIKYQNQYNFQVALPNLKLYQYNFEIDAYEADRVWVIVKGEGKMENDLTKNGKTILACNNRTYNGPPEAVSVSINDQGLCYKITSGYVLDKSQGNTYGLGGNEGILEAIGCGLPFFETRSFSDLVDAAFGKVPLVSSPTISKKQLEPSLLTTKSEMTLTKEKKSEPAATKVISNKIPDTTVAKDIKISLKNTNSVLVTKPTASVTKSTVVNTTTTSKANINPFSSFGLPRPLESKTIISSPKISASNSTAKVTAAVVKTPTPPAAVKSSVPTSSFFSFGSASTTPKNNGSVSKESVGSKPSTKVSQTTTNVKPSTVIISSTKGISSKEPIKILPTTQPLKKNEKEVATKPSQSSSTLKVINDTTKKYLTSKKISAAGISAIDSSLVSYQGGTLAADGVYKQLIQALGSKDEAYEVFPYIIGSLEKGDKKTILNRYYQQQAN